MIIYKTTNLINGKIYIGQKPSMNTGEEFFKSKYYGSGTNINKAIKEFGEEKFKREIIDNSDDIYKLCEKEEYWIEYYNSTDPEIGYNIAKRSGKFFNYGNKMSKENLERISKKVYQYDFYGNFIKKYNSILDAENENNISEIGKCCNGIFKRAGNYIWSFEELNIEELNIKIRNLSNNNKGKDCYMYDLSGKLLNIYKSQSIAQIENNIPNIWGGKNKNGYRIKSGYIWSLHPLDINDFNKINDKILNNPIKGKKVGKFDKLGDLILEYSCLNKAYKDTGINATAISNCAKGRSKTAGGFIWKFI